MIELNDAIRRTVDEDLRPPAGLARLRCPAWTPRSETAAPSSPAATGATTRSTSASRTPGAATRPRPSALTENNLYTLEAFDDNLDHLRPGGAPRVAPAARARRRGAQGDRPDAGGALRRRGIDRPERNVVVVLGSDIFGERYGTVLARLEPDSRGELDEIAAPRARARGGGVVFAPGGRAARMGTARGREQPARVLRGLAPRRLPAHLRRPFFFNMTRLGSVGETTPPGYVTSADLFCAADHARHPGGPVRGRAGRARLALGPARGAAAALLAVLLRGVSGSASALEVAPIQRFVLFLGFLMQTRSR